MDVNNPYYDIFIEFSRRQVKYLIVGGYAAILYGANRMTKDMDIIIELSTTNLGNCLESLKKENFNLSHQYIKNNEVTPENILRWKSEKHMRALRFENRDQPFLFIDIVLDLPGNFDRLYERRFSKKSGGHTLFFMSKEDLVEMKSKAGRLQDFQDNFSLTGETIWLDKLKKYYSNENRQKKSRPKSVV